MGEPTSTFGDEAIDQAVEDMVVKLTHALMNSDHVEDVFAEDAVIRRDIFRVLRDGLREPHRDVEAHAARRVTVKLDTLGYVAATASRRADPTTLAGRSTAPPSVARARFSGFSPELREATFRLDGGGPDERLEIEEAVADELDRSRRAGPRRAADDRAPRRARPRRPRRRAARAPRPHRGRRRGDARSAPAAPRAGSFADPRTLRVLFTPLSEQDARGVDAPTIAFAREVFAPARA